MDHQTQDRLSTILENNADAPSKKQDAGRWSAISKKSAPPRASAESRPPPYARFAFQEDGYRLGEGEKTARIKTGSSKRGGLGRLLLILLGVLVLLAIALGVGLGVGLTRSRKSSPTADAAAETNQSTPAVFPFGEYSFITALHNVQTNCTSNPATWSCWPYTTYNSSPNASITSNAGSMATFNWVLSNTSSIYPTNSTGSWPAGNGVSANVSVSTTSDPFGISFTNQNTTWFNTNSNPYLSFSFTMSKNVVPSTSITSDNTQSQCFYNETMFTATIYLSNSSYVPMTQLDSLSVDGGYTPWPYAVKVEQTSPGGQDIPACYETIDGDIGQRITSGLTAEPANSQCVCEYQNF